MPDNRWQIVSYVADDDGYRATVRYESGPHDIPRAEQSHWGFSTGITDSFDDDEGSPTDPVEYNPVNPSRIPHRINHHPHSGDPHYGKPPYQPQLKPLPPNRPPYQGVLTSQVNTFIVHPTPAERPDDGRKQFEHHHRPHFSGGSEPKQTSQQKPPQLLKDVAPSSSSSPTPVYIPRPYPTTGHQQSPRPTTPPPIYTAPRPEKYPDPPVYIPKEKSPQFKVTDSIIYDPNEYHPFFQPTEKPKILTFQPIRPFHLPDQFYENRFNQHQSAVTNLERPIRPTQQQNQQRPQENHHRQPPPSVPQKKEQERPLHHDNRPYLDKPVSNEWTPIYQPALPYQPYEPQQKPDTQESIPSYPAESTEPYVPKQRLPFKASPPYPIEPTVEQQRPSYQPPAVYPSTPAPPVQTIKPQRRPSFEITPSYADKPIEPESSYPEKPVELYEAEERPSVKPLPSSSEKPVKTYGPEKKPGYEALPYPEEPVQTYQPQQLPGYETDSSYPDKPDPTYDSERKPEYEPTVPYDEKPYEPVTAYPGKPYESVAAYPDKQDTPYEQQPEYERPEKPEYEPAAPPYDEKRYEPATAYPDKPYEPQTEPPPPYVDKENEAVAPYPDRATETYEPKKKPEYEPVPSYPDYAVQQPAPTPAEEYRPQYQTDRPFIHQQTEDIRHPYRQYPSRPLQSIRPIYNRPPGNYRQPPSKRPYGVPHTGYSPGTPLSGITSIRPILNPKNQSLLAVDVDYSLEGEAPTEAPEFEPEQFVMKSTKKPEPPRKAYQPAFRKPFRDSPIRPKITRPFNNRVPVELPVQQTTEKLPNEQDSPLLAKYKFKGSTTSSDGYGQRTQPRRKQPKQSTGEFTITYPIEEDGLDESIRSGYNSQRVENDHSYLAAGIPNEDQISELDSFLPIEEEFYSSNTSDSDVLYFDDGMIPPLLLRVRDKIPPAKIAEDIPLPYAVTELVNDIPTTTAIPAQIPSITAPPTETPSTTIASTTIASTTTTTKTTTSTKKPSTKAGKRKKKKRVRAKALKRGNGTGTIMRASKKVQTVSVIVKDVPTANVTLPIRTSPRIRFPPRVRFVQKTAERVTRQNEKDADLIGSHSVNEPVISRDFQENDMIENHAMTKEDLMEWSLNAIPVEQLDLVYDSVELEDKPAE